MTEEIQWSSEGALLLGMAGSDSSLPFLLRWAAFLSAKPGSTGFLHRLILITRIHSVFKIAKYHIFKIF